MSYIDDIGSAPGQAYDWAKRQFISLTKPDDTAPGDYTTRSAAIARQQKLAEALSQMGQQEQAVSTAGGITAPMSPMGALARGLTSFGGSYLSGKAAADEAALKKAQKTEAATALESLYKLPDTTGLVPSTVPAGTTPTPLTIGMPTLPGQKPSDVSTTMNIDLPNAPRVQTGTIPGGARPYAEQQQMLNQWFMGDNAILSAAAPVLAAQLKPEYFAGSEYGNYSRDALGKITEIVPSTPKNQSLGPMGDAQKLLSTLTPGTKPYADTVAYIAKLNALPVGMTINTGEKSLKTQLGTNVANALETSATQARSAINTLGVVTNIRNALVTGKVITGPGTTARQIFLQLSGNNPEALAQTRQVIQGLAQLTLNSRGLLKGQGQVSDFEGRLLEKAQSGNIDNLTGTEISTVIDVIERQGRDAIKLNKTYVQKAKTGDVFDFFDVDEPAPTSGAWTGRR